MDIGEERAILLPERVGMLSVWAETRVAMMAAAIAAVNCILKIGEWVERMGGSFEKRVLKDTRSV
jgi:hypothetical protein